MYLCFVNEINSYYWQCNPLKTKQISYSRINKPWLTTKLIQSITLKSKYFMLYRSGRLSKQLNNQTPNNINRKVKGSNVKYFKICLTCIDMISKRAGLNFHYCLDVKSLRLQKKGLNAEGITITEDLQVAEAMNEYYASVGSNLDSELPPTNDHENIPLQQHFEFLLYISGYYCRMRQNKYQPDKY